MQLINRRSVLAVFGAAVLCTLAGASGKASDFNKATHLKFSGPVALPGVALGAGEYVFELADSEAFRNVVRVTNKRGSRTYFLGVTLPADRPATAKSGALVTLGEARPGTPVPITAWFPEGERVGRAFIY